MKSEYKVVSISASSVYYREALESFTKDVNYYLSKGWKVVDGVSIFFAQNVYYFYQTLIRETEE